MKSATTPLPPALSSTAISATGYVAVAFTVPMAMAIIALRRLSGYSPRFDPLIRFGAAFLPALFGIRCRLRVSPEARSLLKVTDRTGAGPFIIVANHVNILDGFLLRGALPASLPIRGVELASHFSWPLYGIAMRLYGNVALPHNAPRAARRTLARAKRILHSGTSLLVMPEGHRTRTGELQRFMSGPFRLARDAGVPVLPVALAGAFDRQRVGHPRIAPGTVEVRIGAPVPAGQVLDTSPPALKALVRDRVAALLKECTPPAAARTGATAPPQRYSGP